MKQMILYDLYNQNFILLSMIKYPRRDNRNSFFELLVKIGSFDLFIITLHISKESDFSEWAGRSGWGVFGISWMA